MTNTSLYDETTFYTQFTKDLLRASHEVIIESPFITTERMSYLYPTLEKIVNKGVKVFVITRDPKEHTEGLDIQSEVEIQRFERLGVQVLLCVGNDHRKLAIIDRKVTWEGSLNILSHTRSREIMRRIDDSGTTIELFHFLKLVKIVGNDILD